MTEEKKTVELRSAPTVEKLKEVKFATEIRAAPATKKVKGK